MNNDKLVKRLEQIQNALLDKMGLTVDDIENKYLIFAYDVKENKIIFVEEAEKWKERKNYTVSLVLMAG